MRPLEPDCAAARRAGAVRRRRNNVGPAFESASDADLTKVIADGGDKIKGDHSEQSVTHDDRLAQRFGKCDSLV